jgi:hypothetical protein
MNIAREILEKHLSKDLDIKLYLRTSPLTYQVVLDAINEAINYTHCCESDSELLPNMESKTKTCYWCKKRKKTDETYYLEKKGKRQIRICVDCNLEHEIV